MRRERLTAEGAAAIAGRAVELGRSLSREAELLVSVRARRAANTRFARNEITSTGDVAETVVTVRAALGKRRASTTMNQTDEGSLRAAVERVVTMARLAPEDPEHMPALGPQRHARVDAAYDDATFGLGAETGATARARAAAAAISAAEPAGLDVAGFVQHGGMTWGIASSSGLSGAHRSTMAELTVTARTQDGSGSGWAGAHVTRAAELDPTAVARAAVERALRSAAPRALPPGRYTVVLEPAAVGALLPFLTGSLDARRADEGRSFFAKPGGGHRVGERLFSPQVTLRSDPTEAATPGAPFDDEGFPLVPTTWIERGVFTALAYTRYWAEKQGKQATGRHGVWHLAGGGAESVDALVAGVSKGLLITRFWYVRWVDPQSMLCTGLTRDGVFLIEQGRVTGPVKNFRFNESPAQMLRACDALTRGTVRLPGGAVRVPALRTHEFHLASTSDAV